MNSGLLMLTSTVARTRTPKTRHLKVSNNTAHTVYSTSPWRWKPVNVSYCNNELCNSKFNNTMPNFEIIIMFNNAQLSIAAAFYWEMQHSACTLQYSYVRNLPTLQGRAWSTFVPQQQQQNKNKKTSCWLRTETLAMSTYECTTAEMQPSPD